MALRPNRKPVTQSRKSQMLRACCMLIISCTHTKSHVSCTSYYLQLLPASTLFDGTNPLTLSTLYCFYLSTIFVHVSLHKNELICTHFSCYNCTFLRKCYIYLLPLKTGAKESKLNSGGTQPPKSKKTTIQQREDNSCP